MKFIRGSGEVRSASKRRTIPFACLLVNYRPCPQPFRIPSRMRRDSRAKGTLLSGDTMNYIQSPVVIITLIIESGTEKPISRIGDEADDGLRWRLWAGSLCN